MNWTTIALTAILLLFGTYEISHGYRQSRRYNLHFLLIGGLLTGWPFLAAGVILLLGNVKTAGSWKYLLLVGWALGVLWETRQRRKCYRENPNKQNQPEMNKS